MAFFSTDQSKLIFQNLVMACLQRVSLCHTRYRVYILSCNHAFQPIRARVLSWFIDSLHFTGQDFTAAQRERAQEDFKVLFKGAPPHPPPHSHTKDSHSTRITLLFLNSAWVLLRPIELSTFMELWDGTSGLSSLSEKTRKSNHLQMKLQRQNFLLSYLKTPSVGLVGVSNSLPPRSQPSAQPSELPVRGSWQSQAISAMQFAFIVRVLFNVVDACMMTQWSHWNACL